MMADRKDSGAKEQFMGYVVAANYEKNVKPLERLQYITVWSFAPSRFSSEGDSPKFEDVMGAVLLDKVIKTFFFFYFNCMTGDCFSYLNDVDWNCSVKKFSGT
jgi:hypothetical protein